MKELPLNDGTVALVDDEDFERLKWRRWKVTKPRGNAHPYVYRRPAQGEPKRPQRIYLHREVLRRVWNLPPGFGIDHVNRNVRDNQKANLRIADDRLNASNRRDNSHLGVGISRMPRLRKNPFRARVYVGRQQIILGCFATAEDARAARDAYIAARGLAMPVDHRRDSSCLEVCQGGPIPQSERDELPPPW